MQSVLAEISFRVVEFFFHFKRPPEVVNWNSSLRISSNGFSCSRDLQQNVATRSWPCNSTNFLANLFKTATLVFPLFFAHNKRGKEGDLILILTLNPDHISKPNFHWNEFCNLRLKNFQCFINVNVYFHFFCPAWRVMLFSKVVNSFK